MYIGIFASHALTMQNRNSHYPVHISARNWARISVYQRRHLMAWSAEEMTPDEIKKYAEQHATAPAIVAGASYDMSEYATRYAIRNGTFPIEVIKAGREYRVRTRDWVESLRLDN